MAVILQPCANKGARKHYEDTIKNTVLLDSISDFFNGKELYDLKLIYPEGQLAIWGVNPSQETKWKRIQPGDVTLLAKQGAVFASGVTTYKSHNPALAKHLWDVNSEGNTWEYIYFISEVQNQFIPYLELNKVIPYKENYVIQGFTVLDDEKSHNVLSAFNLESETYFPDIDIKDVFDEILKEEDLDTKSASTGRKEQATIRRLLFQNKPTGNCCICHKKYPVKFLWASHIKKRSKCSLKEKKDLANVAAPMCKFGCDELYEKGYIGIKDGIIVQLKYNDLTNNLQAYIDKVIGEKCSSWNNETKKYFNWHLEHFK